MRSILGGLMLAALGFAACVSSRGAEELPSAQRGIGTMSIDAVTAQFDIRYVEDVSPVRDTVSAIVEKVWNLLPEAYAQLDVPIEGANPDARLLGNTGFRPHDRLADMRLSEVVSCGRTLTGELADQYDLQLKVLTQIHEAEGKSVVSSVVDATARPRGVSGNTVRCSSTGRLEHEIVTRIRSQLVNIE